MIREIETNEIKLSCPSEIIPEAVTSNSTDGLKGKLTHIAASLLKARLSDFEEDYPKSFPKHVLQKIERHNECLRVLACELVDLKRAI